MYMALKFYLKRIGAWLYTVLKNIENRLHYWKISTDKNITLNGYSFIASSAHLDVKLGGTIYIDKNTEVMEGVLIQTYGGHIKIGSNCSINPYTIIYGHGNTTIGNNVLIAGGCMIIPSNHNFESIEININAQGNTSHGIVIEDNVWIGHGCSILDKVKIGHGSIIAAGSVVKKTVPPLSVAGGVPAKIIRMRK
jgi:acetyltransferase-like isoleucine patch superfamily enzyme